MSSTASVSRICPVCDAPNSSISLFCAECGASLEAPVSGTISSLDQDSASQQTAALPAAQRDAAPSTTSSGVSQPSWMTPPPVQDSTSTWDAGDVAAVPTSAPERGMRGFYLGLLATLLIIALLLVWGWASILDDDARSSISGFFDFIG